MVNYGGFHRIFVALVETVDLGSCTVSPLV